MRCRAVKHNVDTAVLAAASRRIGVRFPTRSARAAMTVVMGAAGFVVAALGIDNIDSYEAFLLVIAY